jgi:hypothetical protein
MRIEWKRVLEQAAEIVRSYETGVTLRQLFYRLVADGTLPNTDASYKGLSAQTAAARRAGRFPPLVDLVRAIDRRASFDGPEDARARLREIYRRDRTEGQSLAVYLGVEKATLTALVRSWFDDRGIPVVTLRGYSSQTYVDDVARDALADGRKAVLLYVGDHDPSGVDIERDFVERSDAFADVIRVAVRPEQIAAYGLVPAPGRRATRERRRSPLVTANSSRSRWRRSIRTTSGRCSRTRSTRSGTCPRSRRFSSARDARGPSCEGGLRIRPDLEDGRGHHVAGAAAGADRPLVSRPRRRSRRHL